MSDAEVGHPTNPSKRVAHNEPLASDVSLHIGEREEVEPTEQLASDARLHIGAPDQVALVEQLASEASLHIGAPDQVAPVEQLASEASLHIGAPQQVEPKEPLASEASSRSGEPNGAEVSAQPHHDAESVLEVYLRGLDQWMLPGDDVKGRKSWIIKTWPGKPAHLCGKAPGIQVITYKKCVYLKPVQRGNIDLPIDSFSGLMCKT